ncbi:hypothetical protein CsSME_00020743 [Camellia sinensis var. sinensis]
MCPLQYYLDSCGSTGQNGQTVVSMLTQLQLLKLVPVAYQGLELEAFQVKLFCHWLILLSMKRQLLEVIKLEGVGHCPEDAIMPRDMFLLQLWSRMDENAVGTCAELIFAPIDASFADDAPLLPSAFRIIPLDSGKEASSPNRTFDLASALEIGPAGNKASNDYTSNGGSTRSVMTIAFEFAFEGQIKRSFKNLVFEFRCPEVCYLGVELLKSGSEGSETTLKTLWHHTDAIMCCSLKALPVFTFANQAGLDMLETTLVALQDITLEKIFDAHGRKTLCSKFPQIMQQVCNFLLN